LLNGHQAIIPAALKRKAEARGVNLDIESVGRCAAKAADNISLRHLALLNGKPRHRFKGDGVRPDCYRG
jgi:hypothetical protein